VSWHDALGVLGSRTTGALLLLGTVLLAIFLLWMLSAQALYARIYGGEPIGSYGSFLAELFTTGRGWTLILVGHLVGAAFAIVVFAVSVVSFPLLLDREVGIGTAVRTSIEAVVTNPQTMLLWAVIVAGLLVVGSAPLLVGLTVVVPILGHAT